MKQKICSIEGCSRAVLGRGWCQKHYDRWYHNGHPLALLRAGHGEPLQWITSILDSEPTETCIIWPFGKATAGYGTCHFFGHTYVHRFVCEKVHGPNPPDKPQAAHSCGNRACVNPRHLRWANQSENENDKVDHDRSHRGQRNPMSKLDEADVRTIRELRGTLKQHEIASKFQISRKTVTAIQLRKIWAWLE